MNEYSLAKVQTITYNDKDQALIDGGASSTGTLQYSLSEDEKTFSETIPTGKNAGDYTVYYRVKGDTNHSDSEIGSVKATIAKRKPSSINWKENYNFVYDGNAKEPKVNVKWKDKDGNEYDVPENQYSLSWNNNINAGKDAEVTVKNIEGGNFDINETKTFTIAKADIELGDDLFETPPAGIKDLIFNGTAEAFVGTAQALIDAETGILKESVPGTLEYSTNGTDFSEDIPTGIVAKKYSVYYRVKGSDNYNNSAISSAMEVEIAAKSITIAPDDIVLDKENYTYINDQTPIKPKVTSVKYGNNTFKEGVDYTVSYEEYQCGN